MLSLPTSLQFEDCFTLATLLFSKALYIFCFPHYFYYFEEQEDILFYQTKEECSIIHLVFPWVSLKVYLGKLYICSKFYFWDMTTTFSKNDIIGCLLQSKSFQVCSGFTLILPFRFKVSVTFVKYKDTKQIQHMENNIDLKVKLRIVVFTNESAREFLLSKLMHIIKLIFFYETKNF